MVFPKFPILLNLPKFTPFTFALCSFIFALSSLLFHLSPNPFNQQATNNVC